MVEIPDYYRYILFFSSLGAFIVMALWEKLVVNKVAKYDTKKAIYPSRGLPYEDKQL